MNSLRGLVESLGRQASDRPSPFRSEADQLFARFREGRSAIESEVKRGNKTVKVARQEVGQLASELGKVLKSRASEFSSTPRVFLDRLIEADTRRKQASERASLEGLQRETNKLLRSVLVEQQIQVRTHEFESRTFVRPVANGKPAPTLESLLSFHENAQIAGDEAGSEWARRQLELYRPLVVNPEDHIRIDRATDRPDRINPRIIETYVDAMKSKGYEELEQFVSESMESKDVNACVAAFVLARQAPEGARVRWVRLVLEGLPSFPETAIAVLRDLEASARTDDREAAQLQADFVISQAENEARLKDLEAPTDAELARRAKLERLPAAKPGEAIGLSLERRGVFAEEPSDTPVISEPETGLEME